MSAESWSPPTLRAALPGPRARLRGDRGSATAETAIVLPTVVLLLVVLLFAGLVAAAQVTAESAARAAAREMARGESAAQATAAARRVAGPNARIAVSRSGEWATASVSTTVQGPAGLLSGARITVRAEAVSHLEPQLVQAQGLPRAGPAAGAQSLLLAASGMPWAARGRRRVRRSLHRRLRHPGCCGRTARLRQRLRQERGSAPAAVLAWVGATVVMLGALLVLGAGSAAQARADTAADLAALAAADAIATGSAAPCAAAASVAERNGARLDSCSIEGQEVVVRASADGPAGIGPLQGAARAGPGPVQDASEAAPVQDASEADSM